MDNFDNFENQNNSDQPYGQGFEDQPYGQQGYSQNGDQEYTQQAFDQGYNQDFGQQGYDQGFNQGFNQGFDQGYSQQNYNQNYNQGFNQGFNQGYNQGYGYQQPNSAQYGGYGTGMLPVKSKVLAGVLCLLFGNIGVGNFYLGKIGMGILDIVFCWTLIPGIVNFIRGIVILCSSDDSFAQKYNVIPD